MSTRSVGGTTRNRAATASAMLRLIIGLLSLPALLSASAQDAPDLSRFEYREIQMGMEVRIVLYAPDADRSRAAARAAFDRIDALEDVFSTYRRSSEINRLNEAAGAAALPVSSELWDVIARAVETSRLSGGAFDVTVGSMIDLWRVSRSEGLLPAAEELESARSASGWDAIELDLDTRTIRIRRPGVRLDLGGIAKGYILDAALQTLAEHEVDRALIEAGGDLRLGGPPPDQAGWRISVPVAPGETETLLLRNAAVSTSGSTEQFVEIDGVRYSHVIDPRTGLGATARVLATVIASDAATSDPIATALTVLGPVEGAAFADAAGADSIYLVLGD